MIKGFVISPLNRSESPRVSKKKDKSKKKKKEKKHKKAEVSSSESESSDDSDESRYVSSPFSSGTRGKVFGYYSGNLQFCSSSEAESKKKRKKKKKKSKSEGKDKHEVRSVIFVSPETENDVFLLYISCRKS